MGAGGHWVLDRRPLVPGLRFALERSTDIEAVDLGNHEVEQDEIGLVGKHRLQPLASRARRAHLETLAGQVVLEDVLDVGLVFDDDDLACRHSCLVQRVR